MKKRRSIFLSLFENLWVWMGGDPIVPDDRTPPNHPRQSAQDRPTPSTVTPPAQGRISKSTARIKSSPHRPTVDQVKSSTPKSNPPTAAIAPTPLIITVQKGDTLFSIADQVNVSVRALIQLNQLSSRKIYVGQTLRLGLAWAPLRLAQRRHRKRNGLMCRVAG